MKKLLAKWLRKQDKKILHFTHKQLTKSGHSKPTEEQFPKKLVIRGLKLDLSYNFSPGQDDVGITVTLPLQWLNSFTDDDFQWLVPGLINEKIELAKEKIKMGEASPLFYFIEKNIMDVGLVAKYMGYWKWTVKKHLKPKYFKKLTEDELKRYAEIFNVTVEELTDIDTILQEEKEE